MSKLNAILNDLVKLRNNVAALTVDDKQINVDDRVSLARLLSRLDEAKEAFTEGRDFEAEAETPIPTASPTVALRISWTSV
jgi:hypothetical protein